MTNHWSQVAFYVTARGLSTSSMPYQGRRGGARLPRSVLSVRTSDGATRTSRPDGVPGAFRRQGKPGPFLVGKLRHHLPH
jgi:hypothetical protein